MATADGAMNVEISIYVKSILALSLYDCTNHHPKTDSSIGDIT